MRHFQIRLPPQLSLENILQEIAKDAFRKSNEFFSSPENLETDVEPFLGALKSGIASYLHEYNRCGLTKECHESIEGGPWVDYSDKIYLLSLPDGFDSFIREVSMKMVDTLAKQVSTDLQPHLHSLLSAFLGHRLARYLYYNPDCRRIAFCESSILV